MSSGTSLASGKGLWRPIAPAPTPAPIRSLRPPTPNDRKVTKKSREQVAAACLQCQKRKTKCDSKLVCTPCENRGLPCQRNTKKDAKQVINRADQLERVFEALCSGTNEQASALLARLRSGVDVEYVATALGTSLETSPSISTETLLAGLSPANPADVESEMGLSVWATGGLHGSSSTPVHSDQIFKPPPGSDLESNFWVPLFNSHDYRFATSEGVVLGGHSNTDTFSGSLRCTGDSIVPPLQQPPSTSKSDYIRGSTESAENMTGFARPIRPIGGGIIVHRNLQSSLINPLLQSWANPNNHRSDRQYFGNENVFVPAWAMMTGDRPSDIGKMRQAITGIYDDATEMMMAGASLEDVAGAYPNIAAIFDEKQFAISPVITQWAARMIRSIKLKTYDFTCFASMYIFWYVMRWMVFPSPETYEAMPKWMRPTPDQLFNPHVKFVDFLIWPAFRDLCISEPAMQVDMKWLVDMSVYERCEWPGTTEGSLCHEPMTGQVDLTWEAKICMRSLDSWSLGPSFRSVVPHADGYVRIREGLNG